MTTLSDAIELTRQYLMTGQQDVINVLDQNIDNSTTTLTPRFELKGIIPGARISIDLEEFHVVSVSGSAALSSITVIRGFNGSTPASHTAGAIIRVNPHFSDWRLSQEINTQLNEFSSPNVGLYQVKSVDFIFNPAQYGYNITAPDLIDIWRVRYDSPGPSNDWPVFNRRDWYLDQDADTSEFSGGKQLVLRAPAYPGHTVRVSYKAKFGGPLTSLSDDILTVTGLHTEAHDILSLGAAINASIGRDTKRTFTHNQPEPRRANEVGAGAATQAVLPLLSKYDERVQAELSRLNQRYPDQI